MSKFIMGLFMALVAFTLFVIFFFVAFNSVAEYQECGYPCPMDETR